MGTYRKLVGDRIARFRKEAGYKTQASLALAMGVDRARVSDWESGKRMPQPRHFEKLEKLLKITDEDLLMLTAADPDPDETSAGGGGWSDEEGHPKGKANSQSKEHAVKRGNNDDGYQGFAHEIASEIAAKVVTALTAGHNKEDIAKIDRLNFENARLRRMLKELPGDLISAWEDAEPPLKKALLVFLTGKIDYLGEDPSIDLKMVLKIRHLLGIGKSSKS